jgi:methylglutamate dehydrogenase subunit D
MLEARSPILSNAVAHHGVKLSEAADFTLTQVAGKDKALKKALGKLPATVGTAVEGKLRIGPDQLWVIGSTPPAGDGLYVTPLSSGRVRLLLEGERAREVLSACAQIDFCASQFKPDQFVMTGIHHTPVLIHCVGPNAFHIYAMRTFALNVWEWLVDQMEGLHVN